MNAHAEVTAMKPKVHASKSQIIDISRATPSCHVSKPKVNARKKTAILLVLAFLCSTGSNAQDNFVGDDYVFDFATPPGHHLSVKCDVHPWARDMNADRVNDLVTIRDEPMGAPELVVFDMVSRKPIWSMAISEIVLDNENLPVPEFIGFFDIDDDGGLREPLFLFGGEGEDLIVIIDPETEQPEFVHTRVLGACVGDFDGDDVDELAVATIGSTGPFVGVYGSSSTAARKRPR